MLILDNRHQKAHEIARYVSRNWVYLSFGLFGCLILVVLATFLNYGLTYDEELARYYGQYILRWYSTLFKDKSALDFSNLYLYGGFFEAISQLIVSLVGRLWHVPLYEARHLINALFGVFAVFCAYKIATQISGAMAGFFSALFLTLTPGFYGLIFNDSKDIPFAGLFACALYLMVRSYERLPAVSYRLVVALGAVVGLALGVRIGGVILLGYLAVFWTSWLCAQWLTGLWTRQQLFSTGFRLLWLFSIVAIVAWAMMLMWWPWAQLAPFRHPYSAMKATAHFDWPLTVFFGGQFIVGTALPWTYLPTWLLISLPEFYFVVLLLGLLIASKSLLAHKEKATADTLLKIGLLVFACCFPVATAVLLHPTMYDGMRQFIFILPSLAALAGISLATFIRSHAHQFVNIGVTALILLSLSLTIVDMVQLHPYQYIFFNRLFGGGVPAAAKRFETDYWGSSHKEGVQWLTKHYRPDPGQTLRVANCEVPFLIRYPLEKTEDLRRNFVVVKPDENPDIYLAITRWQCHKMMEGKLVYTVERKGTPLLYVYEVDRQRSYRPEALRKMPEPN